MGTRLNRLGEAVLTSTHNLCFEQKYENYQNFSPENFHFLVVKISVYLNRYVFVLSVSINRAIFCLLAVGQGPYFVYWHSVKGKIPHIQLSNLLIRSGKFFLLGSRNTVAFCILDTRKLQLLPNVQTRNGEISPILSQIK